jgi:hypothetical protein
MDSCLPVPGGMRAVRGHVKILKAKCHQCLRRFEKAWLALWGALKHLKEQVSFDNFSQKT